MLIKSYFKVVRFEFRFESVNVRNHTYNYPREARSTGSAPHTRTNVDRTAPGCAAEQSATPGQLIEGRDSVRVAKSTRRGRPGLGLMSGLGLVTDYGHIRVSVSLGS